MNNIRKLFLSAYLFLLFGLSAQQIITTQQVQNVMFKASRYMVEEVSTQGGYVWYYLPDFSRRWGEMEAYSSMIWLQNPGTISMGHLFLDAYKTTKNDFYYQSACKVANAIIKGQLDEGGWNYMVDFAGDESIQKWYKTIGKNGWRLEEFQYYYGNATFDDDVSSEAARFLLRIYLEKQDASFKPALSKAINFILQSQYPIGAWPQRFPLRYDFENKGHPDYTSYYTFNDNVIWENIQFLIQCYQSLGDKRYLEPILRGMKFYVLSQDSCGAWGQQLTTDMKVSGARTYEPAAYLPQTTCENALLLLKFYQFTGDTVFLHAVPKAIEWLENAALPEDKIEGERTHPTFVDIKTNQPLYLHRKGSNTKYGLYYMDDKDDHLLAHYYGKARIPLQTLKEEYSRISSLNKKELTLHSPLILKKDTRNIYYELTGFKKKDAVSEEMVLKIVKALDSKNRWLTTRAMISHPYIGEGKSQELTDKYDCTMVGDETDTSPYRDTTSQQYISTREYIRNMKILIRFLGASNSSPNQQKQK